MIYLIRHAEKKSTLPDSGLTRRGILDCRSYADSLVQNGIKLDRIITSPIQRCVQTASEIAYIHGIGIEKSDFLGDPGVFVTDDKIAGEIFNRYKLVDIINMQLTHKSLNGFAPLKTGSLKLLEFMSHYRESNVLMISHDAIIMPFVCHFSKIKKIQEKDIVNYLDGYRILLQDNKCTIRKISQRA